ncbi:MAG: multicopper oxidase domain-containing protein [Proteobacteria bacterium]|nr:multicopper oxidase domain-containing protein [Pseudomonadota bacterium]
MLSALQFSRLDLIVLITATLMLIASCSSISNKATTHTYYIAADEIQWDYAPTGKNQITGRAFSEDENVFVATADDRIGKVYIKSVYREYTDATFSTLKPRGPEWEHLGYLGPVIRAGVGDEIKIVFKNNLSIMASVHPHGVFYTKDAEGSPYNDGTSGADKKDNMIHPGDTFVYEWSVPERSGPGPNDPSSIVWMYHSHVDSPKATNSGLIGPIIISRESGGYASDVDREFVTLFTVTDENDTYYLDKNIQKFTKGVDDTDDDDFYESNLMHGMNGFVYGNLPGMVMKNGERVRWYLIGLGTEIDLHTPHWHGHTVLFNGNRTDVLELMPASLKTVDMTLDNEGTWLFHCHVNDHIKAGMLSMFTVLPK